MIGESLDQNLNAPKVQPSGKKKLTLNQPVSETIQRDLMNIVVKLKYAMIPSLRAEGQKQLRNWDLWGPLLLCLMLSITLSWRTEQQAKTVITTVFVIMWVGSVAVFINGYFLGTQMSLGQSASLLGYCLFPINVASFVMIFVHSWLPPVMKLGMVVFAFVWASWSSTAFMGESVSIRKRKLALYPVILFYVFFSWFVLIV